MLRPRQVQRPPVTGRRYVPSDLDTARRAEGTVLYGVRRKFVDGESQRLCRTGPKPQGYPHDVYPVDAVRRVGGKLLADQLTDLDALPTSGSEQAVRSRQRLNATSDSPLEI